MDRFADALKLEISKGLPGTEIQWALASSDRMVRNFPRTPREDSASAAVLILLYQHENKISTLFIQRPDYDGVHGGQISFPGGKSEKNDHNLVATALREAEEETGLISSRIEIVGLLTPLFIPVSNIVVTPVIGWTGKRPHFNPDPEEVSFLIEADLSLFLDNSIIKNRLMEIRGEQIDIRYFDYEGHVIWGATAMILHELLFIIRRAGLSPTV